jgi:hypothetical protein
MQHISSCDAVGRSILHSYFPDRLFVHASAVLEERAKTRVSVKDRAPGLLRDILTATKEIRDILQVLEG